MMTGVQGVPRGGLSWRCTPRLRAFTLLELLVAMAIFAMVLTSVYGTWRLLMQGNAAALELAARAQRKRLAVQTVEEALNSAVFFAVNATNYSFFVNPMGTYADLSFVAHLGDTFPGSGRFDGERLRRVWFTVEEGPDGTPNLMLRQASMLAPMDQMEMAFPIVLARNVAAFQAEFWNDQEGDFGAEWLQTNRLPALARISMALVHSTPTGPTPPEWVVRWVRLPSVGVAADAQVGAAPAGALP